MRRGNRFLRCIAALGVLALCLPVSGGKKSDSKTRTAPKPAAIRQVPAQADKFRPSGALRAYRISGVEVSPPPPSVRRQFGSIATDAARFQKIFDGAIVFQKDLGMRIVPSAEASSAGKLDYIEIRTRGSGFGVNSDASSNSSLYLSNFRLTAPKDTASTAPAMIDGDAEINYIGASNERKQMAHLKMGAEFVEDLTRPRESAISQPTATPGNGRDADSGETHSRGSRTNRRAPAKRGE